MAVPSVAGVERTTSRWIRGPFLDGAIAFAWVPAFALTRWWATEPDRLRDLLLVVLVLSFSHQPITLPLVYGDVRERRRHGALLLVPPVVAVLVIYVGLTLSLALVAVIAGVWNALHTLRQRYGIVRVYGRKVGQDHGNHEQAMLLWWFAVAASLSLSGDRLRVRLDQLEFGPVHNEVIDLLVVVQPIATVALVPCVVAALVVTSRWSKEERQRPRNRAKHVYLAGAAISFAVAPFDPVAGLLGLMSAHAIEYVAVVAVTLRRRVVPGSLLAGIVRPPGGPVLFLASYLVLVFTIVFVLRRTLPWDAFYAIYFSVGALHFVYDGMIWRLRRPEVAGSFSITPA